MTKKSKQNTGQLDLFGVEKELGALEGDSGKAPVAKEMAEPAYDVDNFERIFNEHTRMNWRIVWNKNRSVMVSYSANSEPPVLRIQQIFSNAPKEVIVEIAKMVESKRKRSWPKVVNLFVSKNQDFLREGSETKARHTSLETRGKVYDLADYFERLNRKYFEGKIQSRLGWMNVRVQRRVSIKLGSYSEETDVIRLHPALDNKKVPEYVIESILHHEMTHAKIKTSKVNGRRVIHGDEFYKELAGYPNHDKADKWIKENMGMLLPRKNRKKCRKK